MGNRIHRLRPWVRGGTLACVAGALLFACSSSQSEKLALAALGAGCSLNSDCENPLACVFEKCHRECNHDRDCPGEARCVKGTDGHVCQLPQDTACARANECLGDQVCGVDGECRDTCNTDADCTNGQVCAVSDECASTDDTKDLLDPNGNILPDPFDDTGNGPISTGGTGGLGSGGTGGMSSGGTGGQSTGGMGGGSPDSGGGTGGVGASGGTGGTGGSVDAGADSSMMSDAGGDAAADGGCPSGFADCTADPGCETNLSLVFSCGSCTTSCDGTNGTVDCQNQMCVIVSCNANFDDCDGDGATGCETPINTNQNCGACGRDCTSFGSTCVSGNCEPVVLIDDFTPAVAGFDSLSWAVANDSIYHMGFSSYVLRRIPIADPTNFVTLWDGAGTVSGVESISVVGTDVRWTARNTGGAADRRTLSKPSGAAPAVVPTTVWMPEFHAEYLTRQGSADYWMTGGYQASNGTEQAYVYARGIAAPAANAGTRLVTTSQGQHGEVKAFEVTTEAIYWITEDSASGIARDVRMVPIDGIPSYVPTSVSGSEVAPNLNGPFAMSAHLDAVYYVQDVNNAFTDGIYRHRRGDPSPTHLVVAPDVRYVLVNADGIYYLSQSRLFKAPLAGGLGVQLSTQPVTYFIGQDASFIYAVYLKLSAPSARTVLQILK